MKLRYVFLVVLVAGCGDDDFGNPDQGFGDVGPRVVTDAAPRTDANNPPSEADVLYADPNVGAINPGRGGAECVESDEDESGAPQGCEQTACREVSPACCVGRAECCSPESEEIDVRFDTCTGFECVDGEPFGRPLPTIVNGFSPAGDAEFDSGVVLAQTIDLRGELVRLEADFVVPTTMCSGLDCLQTVGVSIARNAPTSFSAHVRTIVGLLWSGGRIYLVVGDRSIKDWSAASGGLWTLEVDAAGDVTVSSTASAEPVNETFPTAILPIEAYIVLHGHNVNPGGGEGTAQLRSLHVDRRQCEMTRQWSARTAVEVGSGLRDVLVGATSPTSVRDSGGTLRVAYIRDGRLITTHRGNDETPNVWVLADEAYDALERPMGTAFAAPELANEEDGLVLYYEVEGQILRAEAADDETRLRFGSGETITDFSVPGATVHAPTYASRGAAYESALVVRVEYEDERRSTLAAFSISNRSGVLVAQLHDLLPTEALGDELGDPELFIRNRLYQLYVPYRRGTRWRLAHMTSEDFLFWNIADDEALESGGAEELFGPRAPSTVVSEEGVEVFYERFDGAQQSFGRIFRRTPQQATLLSTP